MGKRILVAIPIVIIVALAVLLQGWALAVFVAVLACACQYEIVRAMDGNGKPIIKTVSFVFAGLMVLAFLLSFRSNQKAYSFSLLTMPFVLSVFVLLIIAAFIIAMFSKKHTMESVSNTIFTFVYPQMFFVLFYMLILNVDMGAYASEWFPEVMVSVGYFRILVLLLMIFLPAMFSDTVAYFIGKSFGKTKLCPSISPKKTVAGCVAGIVGGIIASVLIWAVFSNVASITMMPLLNYIFAGAALAVISQLGDLSASFIKRSLNIKDFGKLLPGHGGIVDRMDSVLFCIPLVFALSAIGIL
ncbi:MAG: CDP-archaeol synthase [Christensenella sp.]